MFTRTLAGRKINFVENGTAEPNPLFFVIIVNFIFTCNYIFS